VTRNIYVVDDDDPVRASLQGLLALQPNLIIRGFRSGDAFLKDVAEFDPGVLLLDFHMPGATGMDVLKALNASSSNKKFTTIILTGQGNIDIAVQAMKCGAMDFLEKPYEPERLLEVVENAFRRFEADSAASAGLEAAQAKIAKLSPRETEVLKGLIEGRPNKIIAHELDLSPRTVEIYRANVMDKLGVRSLSEALRIAFAAGLIPGALTAG
jgi:two-component system response regulator FixJ